MSKPKIFSFEEWESMSLRVSVFVTPSADLSKDIVWQTIFSTVPDNQNIQPKTGVVESSGEFDDHQFVLRTLPGRADLIYQRKLFSGGELHFHENGNFLEGFISKANILLKKFQELSEIEIVRLAFGTELHLPKPDRLETYKALKKLLHYVSVDETAAELQYSINRKRQSNIDPKIEINRLSQWSTQRMEIGIIHQGSKPQQMHESFVCRLVLDINTVPSEEISLQKHKLVSFYGELVQLGKEIAEYGDIK